MLTTGLDSKQLLEHTGYSLGIVSSDFFGTVGTGVHTYALKDCVNMYYEPFSGFYTRSGTIFIDEIEERTFFFDWFDRTLIFRNQHIELIEHFAPYEKKIFQYNPQIPDFYNEFSSLLLVGESEHGIIFFAVKKNDNAQSELFRFTKNDKGEVVFDTTPVSFQNEVGNQLPLKPSSATFTGTRLVVANKGSLYFSSLTDITQFRENTGTTALTDPFKLTLSFLQLAEDILDVTSLQNYILVGTTTSYILLAANPSATSYLELYSIFTTARRDTSFLKFVRGSARVYAVGDDFIDAIDFNQLTKLIGYENISTYNNFIFDKFQNKFTKMKIAGTLTQNALRIFIVRGGELFVNLCDTDGQKHKISTTAYHASPDFSDSYQSEIVEISNAGHAIKTKLNQKYYLEFFFRYPDNRRLTREPTSEILDIYQKLYD